MAAALHAQNPSPWRRAFYRPRHGVRFGARHKVGNADHLRLELDRRAPVAAGHPAQCLLCGASRQSSASGYRPEPQGGRSSGRYHLRQDIDLNPRAAGVGTDASRPYRGFGEIYENNNTGMSDYNALQVNISKRPGGGKGPLKNMTLLANYTYSKAMEIALSSNGGITDVGSSKGSGLPYGNPNQGHFETGPAPGQDRTHRFVASYVWDLPKMSGSNAAVKALLGGWQWSGIF